MIKIEEAVDLLLQCINPQTKIIELDILEANSSIIADDVYAPFPVPPFSKSAMDGYAIISNDSNNAKKDHPVTLDVIRDILVDVIPNNGTALRIMTGDAIPKGYDCVIKQEDTDYGENQVQIYKKMKKWENYCKIGEDIEKGQLIISKYTKLNNFHIGILASLGIAKVNVLSPMKVGILAVGNEIINPGSPFIMGKIYNSCSYTISALLKSKGIEVEFMDTCLDNANDAVQKIEEKLDSIDMLITIGSISVGTEDIIPETLRILGSKQIFKHVNMKPGTPVLANFYKNKIILSLSGNPFAAFTNFHLFFWPLLEKFMCNKELNLKKTYAVVKEGYVKSDNLRRFIRAYEEDGFVSITEKINHSSVLSNLVNCNCLIDQIPNNEINVGDRVKIIYFK